MCLFLFSDGIYQEGLYWRDRPARTRLCDCIVEKLIQAPCEFSQGVGWRTSTSPADWEQLRQQEKSSNNSLKSQIPPAVQNPWDQEQMLRSTPRDWASKVFI